MRQASLELLWNKPAARRPSAAPAASPSPTPTAIRPPTTTTRPGTDAFLTFDSWSAWVAHCERSVCPAGYAEAHRLDDHEWSLGVDFPGAVRMAREGWPEGTRRASAHVLRLADKLAPQLEREEYFFDRAPGLGFDMARVLTSDPDCWFDQTVTHVRGPGRPLVIVVNRGASAWVQASVIERRGIAVAAFAMLAERAGRACEIRMLYRVNGHGLELGETITLKRSGEPVNLDVLTYALAHPATHRRLALASREGRHPHLTKQLGCSPHGDSYGVSCDPPEAERGDVYLPCMTSASNGGRDWSSPTSAEKWVADQLRAAGAIH